MAEQQGKGWFGRLKDGVKLSTGQLPGSMRAVFTHRTHL